MHVYTAIYRYIATGADKELHIVECETGKPIKSRTFGKLKSV